MIIICIEATIGGSIDGDIMVTYSTGDLEFGPQSPPLTDQIASVLRRYPDGGQILKVCSPCAHVFYIIIIYTLIVI